VTAARSAADLVRRHAAVAGAEPALIEGGTTVTWADLDRRCDLVASSLAEAGVGPGDLVAMTAQPSIDAIVRLLGTVRSGAVAAPVPDRITATERASAMDVLSPVLELGVDRTAHAGRTRPGAAVVVLTSGTTGRPKGVVLSEAAMAASASAWIAALPPASGWLLALGLGHVAGLGIIWRAVAARVPVRIVPEPEPGAVLTALAAEPPASHMSLVPTQLVRILDRARDMPPPASLLAVPLGGGLIGPELVTRAVSAGWPVVPTYGLSEAGSGVTALPTDDARDTPASAGRPLPGVSVSIDEPGEDGVGEIIVATPGAFDGYLGESPRAAGTPIRTGDLGRLDETGRLFVGDRRTDRIVRGGENISPPEVEAVLEVHPAIAEAAVVARPDPLWGQVPVAVIVLRQGIAHPGAPALAAHCRASLAGFKVPGTFVRVASLPRTGGGKLRRSAVREMLDRPVAGALSRPDGTRIGWRSTGTGPASLVLLHGTLSTAAQIDRLAAELARPGAFTVHAVDRRATGTSRVAVLGPIDVRVHVADLVAVLDHLGIGAATLVGLSYGGVLALETAARHPERVTSIVAWEPPYGPLADAPTRQQLAVLAAATAAAHRSGGAPAAAETFLRGVAGDAAWERLSERGRAFLADQGDAALADATLLGLDADGMSRITAPTTILTGGASDPFYGAIACTLSARVPDARRVHLDDLSHASPITEPVRVGAAVLQCLEARS
jgi:O-succinylbenzoic acid--CoA ligase